MCKVCAPWPADPQVASDWNQNGSKIHVTWEGTREWVTAKGCRLSFWGDKNPLKLVVVMVVQV